MTNPVQEIKDRLSIVDVVSMYVKLEPAGKNMKAKSPFTNEKTPSFFVSPDKGLYHCFSTGKGGDIFTFVQELEGVDFRGALKILADKAGISLENHNPKESAERDRLYAVMEEATKFFEKNLEKSDEAKKYLLDRGVEEKMITEFRLGLAQMAWRDLYEHLREKFSDKDIILAGLGKNSEKGIYDTFRDRIMFPIMDTAGRIIAFSGRILHPDDKSGKYVNSPDTPLFNKSDVLFALDKAKNYIRKYNFTILVEGQFDVLMLHQAGFRNTVGVSGTALADSLTSREGSVNNLGLVKRLSSNLILAFDSDEAGVKATLRSAEIALNLGMDVKVVTMDKGKDPAEILQNFGREGWSKILREAKHVIEFSAEKAKAEARDMRDLGKKIITLVLPQIASLPSETEKSFFLKKVADITELSENSLRQDLAQINTSNNEKLLPKDESIRIRSRKDEIERKLMAIYFAKAEDIQIKEELEKIIGSENFLLLENKFKLTKDELVFEIEAEGENDRSSVMREMLVNLEEDYLKEKIETIKSELRKVEKAGRDDEAEKLSHDYQKLVKRLSEIKNSRHLNKF